LSDSGLVAYRTGEAIRRELQWFDRSGSKLGSIGVPEAAILGPRISPDGGRVIFTRTLQSNQDLWMFDGDRMTRLTLDPLQDRLGVWSPDGNRIIFDSNRTGARDLYIKESDQAGGEQLVVKSDQNKNVTDWSPDGRYVIYHSTDSESGRDLWIAPIGGAGEPWISLKTDFHERWGQFSPDGRWVAYMSDESGQMEIYVRSFSGIPPANDTSVGSGRQWPISRGGGIYPQWSHDAREIFYLDPSGTLMTVPITTSATEVRPGVPAPLFKTRIYGGGIDTGVGLQYDVSRDGRFLINTVLDDSTAPITLLQNWKPR
jgi:Tol biopolymer transport system component